MMAGQEFVTGLVLAGGLARRMGGRDKGLIELRGRPLVAHVVERLAPQVGSILINANRNVEVYAAWGPVVQDAVAGFAGPLAGLHAGLKACDTPLLAAVPCDAPMLPLDLVARLAAELQGEDARVAAAYAGARPQPAFLLCRRDILSDLETWLVSGGRRMQDWLADTAALSVEFPDAGAFANVNTAEDLTRLETASPIS